MRRIKLNFFFLLKFTMWMLLTLLIAAVFYISMQDFQFGFSSATWSSDLETLPLAITGLCWASLFDGANHDHDYCLARAAGLRCLETCFPKETTEGQLQSAEQFSLLCMCVLALCLWPTDPKQQLDLRLLLFSQIDASRCALHQHLK